MPPSNDNREFTIPAVILGIILSIVMGAANVYLGLRAGMTVSASIPAAVISMGILQGVFRRKNILESNLVQTSASAGESLAAGIIFTMPAMILSGLWETFNFWTTSIIALTGGMLGILFMIPMRKVFVVDSQELKYPEGLACAAVLQAGQGESDEASSGSLLILMGLIIGGLVKFCVSFLGLFKSITEWAFFASTRVFYFGFDISPALVSVGVVVGLPIAIQIFIGGFIGWLVAIPLMTADISSGPALDAAWDLWSSHVRYIGVGTMVVGGVVSIWKVRQGLVSAVNEMGAMMQEQKSGVEIDKKNANINGGAIFLLSLLCILLTAGTYYYLLHGALAFTLLITVIMIVMAFFFTAVASYIVGLVGNSNSPVSGMTISTILVTGGIIYLAGYTGTQGMIATLGVAGVICCVACTSGDVCNDLKTGHILGASPRNQQIMQIIGVVVASFVLAPVMTVLHQGSINNGTGGIGGRDLAAPQAKLFSSLVDGFFGNGVLPWDMVFIGVIIGLALMIIDFILEQNESEFRLHIMPVAIGIYLPLGLSVPIFFGGILNWLLTGKTKESTALSQKRGLLTASGMIAGESLMGVLLGFITYMEIKTWSIGGAFGDILSDILSIGILFLTMFFIYRVSKRRA